jgi:hypothetical protein
LAEATLLFPADHVIENWSLASRVVGGKPTYSGAYHWELVTD